MDVVNIVNMVEVVEVGIMLPAVCGRIPRGTLAALPSPPSRTAPSRPTVTGSAPGLVPVATPVRRATA